MIIWEGEGKISCEIRRKQPGFGLVSDFRSRLTMLISASEALYQETSPEYITITREAMPAIMSSKS